MNRLEAILYMDSIAFLEDKTCSWAEGQCYDQEEKPAEENTEGWTVEYLVDRLFFEMLELQDDAQGWKDYQHKGQRKKYCDIARDAIKMAAGQPSPIFVINITTSQQD
jgi:hypothetical protein